MNIMDRIFHAWTSVFIFRLWCLWINQMEKQELDSIFSQLSDFNLTSKKKNIQSKRQYFITYQSHFSVEINAHSLVYLATLVSEGQLPFEALTIWLQNSQSCESTFRSARSISSLSSSGVNFTVSQFLNRINKLSVLQNIKSNTNHNKLRFPQHHKLSTTLGNTSNSLITAALSKTSIENSVLNAYKYAMNLFSPLKIKELLRNGRPISIQELSDVISRQLDTFWSTVIDNSNITSINPYESDNDTDDDDGINDLTDGYDSDEELEIDGDKDAIHNGNILENHGVRLFDSVKHELAHSYFQVTINNERKYLHKQSACWLLQNDKSSLSADRLSRVQGK